MKTFVRKIKNNLPEMEKKFNCVFHGWRHECINVSLGMSV